VALAEEALGRWAEAESHLDEALHATDDAWIKKRHKVLAAELESIREHLGSVQILGSPPGAEVTINGKVVGRLPLARPLRLAAGSAIVEVRAPGFFPVTRTVVVAPRGSYREPVDLVAASTEPAPATRPALPPPPAPDHATERDHPAGAAVDGAWKKPVAIAAAVGAGLALATGVAFHVLRENRASDFNRDCAYVNGMATGAADCSSRYSGVTSAVIAAGVGYGAAAVLGGASLFLFLTAPATPSSTSTAWACAPTAQGWGLGCARRF